MLFNNILVVLAVAAGITKAAPIKQRDEVDSAFVPISGWHGDSIGNVKSDKVKKDEMEANAAVSDFPWHERYHGMDTGNVESTKVKKDEMEANTMDFNPKNVAFVPISGWHGD